LFSPGYYITWIDQNPETLARQEALEKRDKMSKDDYKRMADFFRISLSTCFATKSAILSSSSLDILSLFQGLLDGLGFQGFDQSKLCNTLEKTNKY
jgi:hypothetical protein